METRNLDDLPPSPSRAVSWSQDPRPEANLPSRPGEDGGDGGEMNLEDGAYGHWKPGLPPWTNSHHQEEPESAC